MSQNYLRERLQEYISELTFFRAKLLEKRRVTPNMDQSIFMLVDNIDLEKSFLEDELKEAQADIPVAIMNHKLAGLMSGYGKILDQINAILGREQVQVNSKQTPGEARGKVDKLRVFAEELNSSWMVELLRTQKEKKDSQKRSHVSFKEQAAQLQTNRLDLAMFQLSAQVKSLDKVADKIKQELVSHGHQRLCEDVETLKSQEQQLASLSWDLKESNLHLRSEYQRLQQQLYHLRKHRQILIEDD